MSYGRDDREALHARNEALEAEVLRLKHEAEARKRPPPVPKRAAPPATPARAVWIAGLAIMLLVSIASSVTYTLMRRPPEVTPTKPVAPARPTRQPGVHPYVAQ